MENHCGKMNILSLDSFVKKDRFLNQLKKSLFSLGKHVQKAFH